MEIRDEEICESFIVETEKNELKQVVISQAVVTHYDKGKSYSKYFRLGSVDGVAVYKTENPDVFQLDNGTILKRKKR